MLKALNRCYFLSFMKMLQGVNTVEYVNTLYQKREKGDCGLTVVQCGECTRCTCAPWRDEGVIRRPSV
jgi:hypothetical protein